MPSILWNPWTVSVGVFHFFLDGVLRMLSFIAPFRTGAGAGVMEEESLASEWEYEADLELLKIKLAQSTVKDRARIRDTIMTWLDKTHNSELESNDLNVPTESENVTNEAVKEHNADNGSNRLDPFEIDLILSNVLRYLPRNSLLKCRLVKRNWNSKAVHWIRKKQQNAKEIKSEDFSYFCMDFENCDLFPLSKLGFTLDGMNLDRGGGDFFTRHGSHILDLYIQDFKYDQLLWGLEETDRENLKRMQHILKRVPNLKTLTLELALLSRFHYDNFIFGQHELSGVTLTHVTVLKLKSSSLVTTEFLDGLLQMCPKADNILFILPKYHRQGTELVKSMQKNKFRFRFIRCTPTSVSFGLWKEITNSQKLKYLLVYPEIGGNVEAQEKMLNSQSECLDHLSLGLYGHAQDELENENKPKLKLPVMKNVRTLKFVLWNLTDNPDQALFPIIPIEPYQLPNVRTIEVWPRIFELGAFANATFTSVQNIKIQGVGLNCGHLQAMADRFPNLKKLQNLITDLGGNQMELIATSWEKLEILEIRILGSSEQIPNFNLVISGVPDLENQVGLDSLPSFVGPRRPSIRELNHLKKLVLTFDSQGRNEWVRIDEIGVHLTFLRLSPKLKLYFRGDFLIQDELAAILTAHYQDVYISPNDPKVS